MYLCPVSSIQGGEFLKTQITYISQAFYDMPPEVAVDLFASKPRETRRDVVALGTQYWLESTFKQKALLINFGTFTHEQLALLRTLAALISGESKSRSSLKTLRDAEWFKAAFAPLFEDVANDMFHMYFCRDNQLR